MSPQPRSIRPGYIASGIRVAHIYDNRRRRYFRRTPITLGIAPLVRVSFMFAVLNLQSVMPLPAMVLQED